MELLVLGIVLFVVPKLATKNVATLLNTVAPQITDIAAGERNFAVTEFIDHIEGDVTNIFGTTYQVSGTVNSNVYDVELRKTIITYTPSENEISHQIVAMKDTESEYNQYINGYFRVLTKLKCNRHLMMNLYCMTILK